MEDKKLAAQLVDADLERSIDPTASVFTYDELEHAPPEVPERTVVNFVIGVRDDLTKRAADRAGRLWRTMRARNPERVFTISVAGYDEDPRELWHLPDVCRYVRRWARTAGIDDPTMAGFDVIPATEREQNDPRVAELLGRMRGESVGFLGACGVFGDAMRADLVGGPPPRPN